MSSAAPILIAGPTASGKSALALALAERFGGVVVNADSMQVYSELRILSARPSPEDEARVPHALYGHVPAREAYSAGRFVADAAAAVAAAQTAGLRPIIVGGTGLYFKALLEGLSPIPPVAEAIRLHWRGEAERLGANALHAVLTIRDPETAARLVEKDTQRIVRALEVIESTGRSLSQWRTEPGVPVIDGDAAVKLLLRPEREVLRLRADARFDQMMEQGALAEAVALGQRCLDASMPAMRALGVAPLIAASSGGIGLGAAVLQAKTETQQYIKRQVMWASKYMVSWNAVYTQEMESIEASSIAFIKN